MNRITAPLPAAKHAVWDKRAKLIAESIAADPRVLKRKQFLADHFGYVGVNYFDSFSPVPDMAALIEREKLTVISTNPIAPTGQFIGTWQGGDATELAYLNSKQEPRYAYTITDVGIDDWCQTALITTKPLNHQQYLRLLWYVTARDTWHGEREADPTTPLPKLEDKIRQELSEPDHTAWEYFHTASRFWEEEPALLTALAAADGRDTIPAIRSALLSRVNAQRKFRDREGFGQHFPTPEAELADEMTRLEKNWDSIRHIAAAIRAELETIQPPQP